MSIRLHEPEVFATCETATGFNNVAGTTIGAGSVLLPSGVTGTRARVTGTASTNMFWTYTGSFNFAGKRGLEWWVYLDVPGPSTSSSGFPGYVRLRSSGGTHQLQANIVLKRGWNQIRLGRGGFTTVAGSPVWDTTEFVDIQWKLDAITGVAPVMYIESLAYAGYARPQVAIVFDDGYKSVLENAFPLMQQYGIPGTVAVISSRVGSGAAYLSLPELHTLHDAGWAMVNHSKTHQQAVLTTASVVDCSKEIASCQEYLIANGFTRSDEHLCYCSPYGEWSNSYCQAAAEAGTLHFRGMGVADSGQPTSMSSGDLFSGGSSNASKVSFFVTHSLAIVNTWSANQISSYVDLCIATGRSLNLQFHSIETPADTAIKTTPTVFGQVLAYLHRQRSNIDFVTLPEFFDRQRSASE